MINDCKIIKDLPSGGQKNVQLAEHPALGLVVIKKGAIKSFTSLERIKREIELLSELKSEPYKHYFYVFDRQIKSLPASQLQRMDSIKTQIKTALGLFKGIEDSVLLDENSDGSHLPTWFNVINAFHKELTK